MHIVLVGPGALGCLFAAMLTKGNNNDADTISLLDHNSKRAGQITKIGVLYQNDSKNVNYKIKTFSSPEKIGLVDAIFLCVKSYDVKETLKYCAPLLQENTLLIFMQNGMAHLEQDIYPGKAIPLFCTTTEGATCLGSGHVRHAGIGTTYLGFLKPQLKRYHILLQSIIDLLEAGGMVVCHSNDIYCRLWAKLFINVGINALTTIHDCKNGALLNIPEAREKMAQATVEAQLVAQAEGVVISSPLEKTVDVCRATAENISSMLQDVRQKKKTEIDAINGAIVKMAEKHNISTPVNALLVKLVKEIEQ